MYNPPVKAIALGCLVHFQIIRRLQTRVSVLRKDIEMNNLSIFVLLLVTPFYISVAAETHESAKPFVSGAGLDHIGVAVRDLDQTRADYKTLGFQVLPGGHFPGGASNAIIDLDDHFYLELITAPDDAKGDDATIIQF